MARRVLPHLAVLALLCALTAVLAHPLIWQLDSALYGGSVTEDGAVNYWNTWHFHHAIGQGLGLLTTEQIFHPMGTNLAYHNHMLLNGALCALLRPLAGPLGAYNLSVLLTFVLCGHGMFLLARRLSGDQLAAAVVGLLFAFCAFRVLRSLSHLNIASNQFLLYYALLLLEGLGRGRPRHLLGAGALLALCGYASYYNLAFALALTVLVALHHVWRRRRGQTDGPGAGQGALRLAVIVGSCAALLAPLIYTMLLGVVSDTPGRGCFSPGDIGGAGSQYGADVLSFFLPLPYNPLVGGLVPAGYYFAGPGRGESCGLFLGCAAILLCGVGVSLCWRDWRWRAWIGAGALFLLVSLGGALRVGGALLLDTPLANLVGAVPFIGGLGTWARWSLPALFCLLVAGAYAMAALRRALATGKSWPRALAVLVALAVVCDLSLAGMTVDSRPAPTPRYLAALAAAREGAVLNVPLAWEYRGQTPRGNLGAVRRYMYHQTLHGRPMVDGFSARGTHEGWRYLRRLPLLRRLIRLAESGEGAGPLSPAEAEAARQTLWLLGVRHVLVHRAELSPARVAAAVALIREATNARVLYHGADVVALELALPPARRRLRGVALTAALLAGWQDRPSRRGVCAEAVGPRPQLLLRLDRRRTRRVKLRLRAAGGLDVLVNGQRAGGLPVGEGWREVTLDTGGWLRINRIALQGEQVCLGEIVLE